jgi:FKBP-type peptidyl-prolyl cis-trans isomerase
MKKLTLALGVAAIATLSLTSCGKSAAVSPEDKAFADSLSIAWGQIAGAQAQQTQKADTEGKFDMEEFIRGVNTGLQCDSTQESYMNGLMMGLNIARQRMYVANKLGYDVDVDTWMKAFRETAKKDSVDIQALGAEFQRLAQLAEQRAEERRTAELANSPEAKANEQEAKAYTDSVKAADPEVKVAESGLVYKITTPGEGDLVTDNDQVEVIYTGRFADGTEFDSSKGKPVTFSPRGVVPGFGEGLRLLAPGGKATLYIPGNLAYGVKGQPQANIGPNKMLIFDVEVVSVKK